MSTRKEYDFVVIGGGPAGQKAAIQAAKSGCRVALVERDRQIGGACVHRGTIPSKTLRENVLQLARFRRQAEELGLETVEGNQVSRLLDRLQSVIQAHSRYMECQLERNGVEHLHGHARFLSPNEVEFMRPSGAVEQLRARWFVIATGSRPRNPDNVPVDHEHIYDSDSILSMMYVPESITVLGGGVIASEYASILAMLGARVVMVDRADRPLRFMEPELTDRFLEQLERQGGCFIGGATAEAVAWDGLARVRCHLDNGEVVETEKVLFALGRVANTDRLGIENAGVTKTPRGLIEVDEDYRTAAPNIYAVGDVIGPPALASTSMEQGRQAVGHALGQSVGHLARTIPIGIFTIPEMASVGLGETALREELGDAWTGHARFEEIARGQISGIQDGLLKLVAEPDTGRIRGVHILGEGAPELIHIGQVAVLKQMVVDEFIENIFNFPTLAEAYRVAALDLRERAGQPAEQRHRRIRGTG